MSLAGIVRSGVAIANRITKPLQATVTHYPWISETGDGAPDYDTGVPVRAVVEHRQRRFLTARGQEVVSEHQIFILDPVDPNGAPDRQEPIDIRDKWVLPDGTTAPAVRIGGLVDAGSATGDTFYHEVWLGAGALSAR
jgi:hypothetical protein